MKKFKSGLFVAFMFILFSFFGCEKEGTKNEGTKNETFTVTWINYNGDTLETDTDVEYGTMPTYNGAEPIKPEDEGHTYSFSGWSPEVVKVTADTTYTAQFSETLKKFTVKWINYNGDVLEIDTDVEYGTTHTYNGAEPTKPNDGSFDYAFTGWSGNVSSSPNTIEYKALFGKIITTDAQLEQIYTFKLNGTEYKIKKYKESSSGEFGTDLVLPSAYKGKPVTSIGNGAFKNCSSLTSIVIPNSVTSIEVLAFSGCSSLTSIAIPNSVTSIGQAAFQNCSSLTSIVIPNSVTSINKAFSGCSSLTSIKVEAGNSTYDSRNNCNAIILTSSNELIAGCKTTVIPSSVTLIGESAFQGRSSLTSIAIPNSVISIGSNAFSYCSSLTSIVIPKSVTSIAAVAFNKCTVLKIYAEATAQPSGWNAIWNLSNCPVYWYSETENTDGHHWRYVDGVPTVWE